MGSQRRFVFFLVLFLGGRFVIICVLDKRISEIGLEGRGLPYPAWTPKRTIPYSLFFTCRKQVIELKELLLGWRGQDWYPTLKWFCQKQKETQLTNSLVNDSVIFIFVSTNLFSGVEAWGQVYFDCFYDSVCSFLFFPQVFERTKSVLVSFKEPAHRFWTLPARVPGTLGPAPRPWLLWCPPPPPDPRHCPPLSAVPLRRRRGRSRGQSCRPNRDPSRRGWPWGAGASPTCDALTSK